MKIKIRKYCRWGCLTITIVTLFALYTPVFILGFYNLTSSFPLGNYLLIPLSLPCKFFLNTYNLLNVRIEAYNFDDTLADISGEWRLNKGMGLYKPFAYFDNDDTAIRVASQSIENKDKSPYRFRIDLNRKAYVYNFYQIKYFEKDYTFDFSDLLFSFGDSILVCQDIKSRNIAIKVKSFLIDWPDIFIYKAINGENIYAIPDVLETKPLILEKKINFSLKDNLVFYDELDSVEIDDVTVLSIAALEFDSIPQKISKYPYIKKLFMPFNKVKFTESDWEVLESLPNLEVLDIRNNEIASSVDPNLSRLKNLKSLKKLYMAGKNVLQNGKLPSGIYDIETLETLSVGQFENLEISPELTKLKNLKALRFYLSNIKTLPPDPLRNITWYYNCTFDPSIPEKDLPKFKHPKFSEILMHKELN